MHQRCKEALWLTHALTISPAVQVTMLSGTGSRVNYKPITPDPESNKALLLPFAAQLHISVQNQEQTWQWLLIRTKPPTLARKTNYLWPSDNQASLPPVCPNSNVLLMFSTTAKAYRSVCAVLCCSLGLRHSSSRVIMNGSFCWQPTIMLIAQGLCLPGTCATSVDRVLMLHCWNAGSGLLV